LIQRLDVCHIDAHKGVKGTLEVKITSEFHIEVWFNSRGCM